MIIDYHMHLELDEHHEKCRFNVARIRQYVDVARTRGIDEIGISEHCNRFSAFEPIMAYLTEGQGIHPVQKDWLARSFREELDEYMQALVGAKEQGLPVKASLEVDFLPGYEDETRAILDAYPFDYIIGSVHFLGTWGVDLSPEIGWDDVDVDQVYEQYFHTMCQAARSGLFDILAHPDLVKKFGHRPSFPLDELYDELAKAAKEGDVAMEINTAGLHKPVQELYPHAALLARFFDRGVPITLGSDAHMPEHVGRSLDVSIAAAKQAGYRTITRFDAGRRTQVPLE